jgi:hypothetical protein
LALVSFHPLEEPLVSCRPVGVWFADELVHVELHLAGPAGARVERLKMGVPFSRLRWGKLASGSWTVAADGRDANGVLKWHAPHVRFRVTMGELSQVNLQFQKVGG